MASASSMTSSEAESRPSKTAQGAQICKFGLSWEHFLNVYASEFCRYIVTVSAGILNPRPSETRSVLIGYFGLLGLIATIR